MPARAIYFAIITALIFLTAPAAQAAQISIVQPNNATTIHSNPGKLTVRVRHAGGAPGGGVQLLLDGAALPKVYRHNVITLEGIDRGSHNLQAVLLDAEGKQLAASATVTFYMWHASRLYPNRK